MKIALLALFFLLLTFTNASDYVYDTSGKPISEAYMYHIAIGEELGRPYFTLPYAGSKSCPLSVKAAFLSAGNPAPLPVKFKNNLSFPSPYAFTSTPLNFTFVNVPRCDKTAQLFAEVLLGSEIWSLMFGDEAEGQTVEGDFIVKDYGAKYSYKIIFCPKESRESCRNLALNDFKDIEIVKGDVDPLEIRFERVRSAISMVM